MKELYSITQLIAHLKAKGVKFEKISEEEAAKFLENNTYYFKLAAYRNLYPKNSSKENMYIKLDFAYLKELSTLDMHVRYLVMEMCLDIEHAIKAKFIEQVTINSKEDGYNIVKAYFTEEDKSFTTLKRINNHKSGKYCQDLIDKYYPNFPIWVLVELISFGNLLHIVQFYEKRYSVTIIPDNKLMNTVRNLRNASAHSNCLLNQINKPLDISKQPLIQISNFVKKCRNISNKSRNNNLHKQFTYDMTTLLFVYTYLMPDIAKKKRFKQLKDFLNRRVIKHKDYFTSNTQIVGAYTFLNKLIDNLVNQ